MGNLHFAEFYHNKSQLAYIEEENSVQKKYVMLNIEGILASIEKFGRKKKPKQNKQQNSIKEEDNNNSLLYDSSDDEFGQNPYIPEPSDTVKVKEEEVKEEIKKNFKKSLNLKVPIRPTAEFNTALCTNLKHYKVLKK